MLELARLIRLEGLSRELPPAGALQHPWELSPDAVLICAPSSGLSSLWALPEGSQSKPGWLI